MADGNPLLQTLLLPPLVALLLYLLIIHLALPLYYRFYTRHRASATFLSRSQDIIRNHIFSFIRFLHIPQRNNNSTSGDSLLGDEELEEGLLDDSSLPNGGRDADNERRLSRELEAGFRDESDDENEQVRSGRDRSLQTIAH